MLQIIKLVNPFHATCFFAYPLKTSENLWGVEKDQWHKMD